MKAIALLSGGLDSTLAIKVVLDQGIDIEAVNFSTPFCQCSPKNGCGYSAKKAADTLGLKLKVFSVSTEYFAMLKDPKYGYGKNLNPCIDCRILMHKKAKQYMKERGAGFIITGEVLGQRPMSQHRRALKIIEKESGLQGLILRPLSSKLLPPTIPENQGWVKREKLLEISGRSRKPQMALARDYKINDYPCPAGGCLLTDKGFSMRMKDLMHYSDITADDIALLKVGRHFRVSREAKVIVGRNKEENERISELARPGDVYFSPREVKGPVGIGRGNFTKQDIQDSASIIARYCDDHRDSEVEITKYIWPEGTEELILAKPIQHTALERLRI